MKNATLFVSLSCCAVAAGASRTASALVDLTVSGVTATEPLFAGLDATVEFTLHNIGDVAVDPSTFDYTVYLSENSVITVRDVALATGRLPAALDLADNFVSLTVMIPPATVPGDYHFGVIVDPGDLIAEDTTRNNAAPGVSVRIDPQLADLTGAGLLSAARGAAGETVWVTGFLENLGVLDATVDYTLYLSSNSVVSTGDVPLARTSVTVAAGTVEPTADWVLIPNGVSPGDYYLGLVIDPDDTEAELDETNNIVTALVPVTIEAASLKLATTFVPDVVVGIAFEWRLSAAGGTSPYAFSVTSGTLPAGLSLDASTGTIAGTPAAAEVATYVIEVTSGGQSASRSYGQRVTVPTVSLAIQSAGLPPAEVGAVYVASLSAMGGAPPYTWALDAGTLPTGLGVDPTGYVSGVPTQTGLFDATVSVTDSQGARDSRALSVRVVNPGQVTFSTVTLPDAQVGEPFSVTLEVVGATPPLAFARVDGALPPGVALDASSGTLAGTPIKVGRSAFEVRVTGTSGRFDLNSFMLAVGSPPLQISATLIPAARVGEGYQHTFEVEAGTAQSPLSWSVGELPAGMSFDLTTGEISGTPGPETGGTYPLLVEVEDAVGAHGQRAAALEVIDPALEERLAEPDDSGCSTGSGEARWSFLALGMLILAAGRRRARSFVVTFLVLVTAHAAWGQDYTAVSQPESYIPVTGLTVLYNDVDDASRNEALPFTVNFYGQSYTSIGISTNGFLQLGGASGSDLSNDPIPDPRTPNGIIAPWWDDLDGAVISAGIEGTAPSRAYVVQFQNARRYGGSSTMNFQVRVYEGSGVVKVNYGPVTIVSDSSSATVGVEAPDGLTGTLGLPCNNLCDLNLFPVNTSITYSQQPDLVGVSLAAPPFVFAGADVPVAGDVTNQGGQDAGGFDVAVMWSTDAVFDASDVTLAGRATVSSLAAGMTQSVVLSVSIPAGAAPDTDYWMFLVPDVDGVVAEADVSNNVSPPAKVRTSQPAPNFVAAPPLPQTSQVAPGDSVSIDLSISNNGTLQGQTGFLVVASRNAVVSRQDVPLSTGTINLAPGVQQQLSVTANIPGDLPTGVYTLGVIVDPDNTTLEMNEGDNIAVDPTPFAVVTGSIVVTTSTLVPGVVGRPYEHRLTAAGGTGAYDFRSGGAIPPGLSLSSDGLLSGTPEVAGDQPVTILVRDGLLAAFGNFTLTVTDVADPLTLVTASLPDAVVEFEYAIDLLAIGGSPPRTWSLSSGSLPSGLFVFPSGLLGGVPGEVGDFTLDVTVMDGVGAQDTTALFLRVAPSGGLMVTTRSLDDGWLEQRYDTTLLAAGGEPPHTWSIDGSDTLPAGLTLEPTGRVSGTPLQVGTFRFVVRVEDSQARSDTNELTLRVRHEGGISIVTTRLPSATHDEDYRAELAVAGGLKPLIWSLLEGELPAGLSLAGDTGLIEGVAGADAGELHAFIVGVEDATARTDRRALSIRVGPAVRVAESGCSIPSGQTGAAWVLVLVVLGVVRRQRSCSGPERDTRPPTGPWLGWWTARSPEVSGGSESTVRGPARLVRRARSWPDRRRVGASARLDSDAESRPPTSPLRARRSPRSTATAARPTRLRPGCSCARYRGGGCRRRSRRSGRARGWSGPGGR